jgi:hypothetical protein
MTDIKARAGGIWKGRLADSGEGRRLLANPDFRAALEQGRRSGPGPSAEELRRELGITAQDLAAADAELDRLEAATAAADALP